MSAAAVQLDLLTAPAPHRVAKPPPRLNARTSLEARAVVRPHVDDQIAHLSAALLAAGPVGLTRQELADVTGIKLQSVCGRVAKMLREEPVMCWEPFERGAAPKKRKRDGRTIVVHLEFVTADLEELDRE